MRDRLMALAAWTDGGLTWTEERFKGYMSTVHAVVDDVGPDACLAAALQSWAYEPPPLQPWRSTCSGSSSTGRPGCCRCC